MGIEFSPTTASISVTEIGNTVANSLTNSANSLFQLGDGAALSRFLDLAKNPIEQSVNSQFGLLANMAGQALESFGLQLQKQSNASENFSPRLSDNKASFNQEVGEALNLIGGLVSKMGLILEQLDGMPQQGFNNLPSFTPTKTRPPNTSAPNLSSPMDGDNALRTLTANFDKLANGKKNFDENDLRRATNGPDKQLAAAAQFMLDNKTFATGVDVANLANRHKREKVDGKFSKDDLRTALQTTQTTPFEKAGLQQLGKEAEQLFAGGNHAVSRDELERIATAGVMPDGSTASKKMKEAANIIMHDASLLERLDVAHAASKHQRLRADGEFGRADLDAVLERSS